MGKCCFSCSTFEGRDFFEAALETRSLPLIGQAEPQTSLALSPVERVLFCFKINIVVGCLKASSLFDNRPYHQE